MRLVPQRRRTRILVGTVTTVVIVVALVLVAYLTPLMSVRNTEITGNHTIPGMTILGAADVAQGTPLLQVDTEAVARRVADIPSVESARVQRGYPSTLEIGIVERTPVAVVTEGDKLHVLDRFGVGYLTYNAQSAPPEIKKLPVFHTATPGPADPTTKAALGVVAGLPVDIKVLVKTVNASSPVGIEFGLTGNRTVVWGDDSQGAEKARTLEYLLTRKATEYNVSSPNFPAYK
ncbi:FtsQ-type POTRA domain-containing protein [Gordonia desulfuricans]|uniref:FtsQ-type POTRA domain-containing protein n=1 Tax=Gordonia desulfuricans TaxID=89051 RepID=A0A7K3LQL7_9ACTN|nr:MULTISPECIES: FtsQ-type POTRA domain-containing protein [Gordonia]EMP13657.2 peptide transporter [Gordonia sp. NB41Y]NDK90490.1 FtsQ-type POTRA domain-containing protein [Gordonia desulfuricans]WLP90403.1 FtsQ-type POTRA domain-containing protein [Gordonia sp. NB41Y]